jgi:hypothetical protein
LTIALVAFGASNLRNSDFVILILPSPIDEFSSARSTIGEY